MWKVTRGMAEQLQQGTLAWPLQMKHVSNLLGYSCIYYCMAAMMEVTLPLLVDVIAH